ncbi:unnamed protein product [Arabidopsis halleri]
MATKGNLKDLQKDPPSNCSAVLQSLSSGFTLSPNETKPGPSDAAGEFDGLCPLVGALEQLLAQEVKLQEELEELRKASPRSIWL